MGGKETGLAAAVVTALAGIIVASIYVFGPDAAPASSGSLQANSPVTADTTADTTNSQANAGSQSTDTPTGAQSSTSTRKPIADAVNFPGDFVGAWTGIARQTNHESWLTKATIPSDSAVADVSYPELHCSGIWRFVSISGSTVTAREEITHNWKSCTHYGTVYLTIHSDGSLGFKYTADSGKYEGLGTLTLDTN